jgi:hypothetical protein
VAAACQATEEGDEVRGLPEIARVEKRDEVALRCIEKPVPSLGAAGVVAEGDVTDRLRHLGGELPEYGAGAVARVGRGDYELPRVVGLCAQPLQARGRSEAARRRGRDATVVAMGGSGGFAA